MKGRNVKDLGEVAKAVTNNSAAKDPGTGVILKQTINMGRC